MATAATQSQPSSPSQPSPQSQPSSQTQSRAPRTVLVAGASGFLGRHLVRHLERRGDVVRRLVRRAPATPSEFRWDPDTGALEPTALAGAEVVVNLGGASMGRVPWTRAYKDEIRFSRIRGTHLLAEAIARMPRPEGRPVRMLQAGGADVYGDRGNEVLDETSAPGPGFFAEICQDWEAATEPARESGAEVVVLRSGAVLAPSGGALGPLLLLLRAGLGGRLGSGESWWPWITLVDHVRAQLHLIDSRVTGPVNLVAPDTARQIEVARALARARRRPAPMVAPKSLLRLAGDDFADFLTSSHRVVPRVLQDDGFTFRHPDLTSAARWVAQ
ncbi:TIGR01777 family oxidoreductase [Georgenia subflava]|uniref:TIGR01777 family protein n=1 Tax=Georgenia subflava TaxID=1622177 RepID=A0A6N7EHX6_9MICO|nr:TIGR01777 family protein [Georgenia subflava]